MGTAPWHARSPEQALGALGTELATGLDAEEAAARLVRDGRNALPSGARPGLLRRVLRQLTDALVLVLLAAAGLSLVVGEQVDAVVILGVVVVNAGAGLLQESRAEAALSALQAMVRTSARVVRSGTRETVDAEQLVQGDLVLLEAGDKVPADLRLVEERELAVDESVLTGESLPAQKDLQSVDPAAGVADRRDMAFAGTLVTAGSATGLVVATGTRTELAEVQRLVGEVTVLATPLTRILTRFSKVLTVVILVLASLALVVGRLHGQSWSETLPAAVALAVGAIPEGLPAALTITLAIGVTRMAQRKAVVRYLPAVETLGSTTVVCTDKTGTLTENRMSVTRVCAGGEGFDVRVDKAGGGRSLVDDRGAPVVARPGTALWWCLAAGAGGNELVGGGRAVAELAGDPTELALLHSAEAGGLDLTALEGAWPRTAVLPFSSELQLMATRHARPGGGAVVLVKGAVERVLELCAAAADADGGPVPLDPEAIAHEVSGLAAQGLRVLATAVVLDADPDPDPSSETGGLGEEALRGELLLVGLQAMWDPPRSAAADAVATCRTAGVQVKMITGDHPATAVAIARSVGLHDDGAAVVVAGAELALMDDKQHGQAVLGADVFARVSPGQKLRLVQALQAHGHVVAMTGDGVNDAPALKQADIGVAMGVSGTKVAQEAADMVLLDDDFSTVAAAVEEGRGVFENLVKFLTWTLPTNLAEGLVVLVAVLLGTTLPILPTQILWINTTTAVLLGLTLAFEPAEKGAMTRPPRRPDAPLLSRPLLARMTVCGITLLAATWAAFLLEQSAGGTDAVARTAAVNALVGLQIVYLFACRSSTRSAWRLGLWTNRVLLLGVGLQVLAQALLVYAPAVQGLFGTAPLGADAWLRVLAVVALGAVVLAVDKALRTRRSAAEPVP
ncbi:MAG: HAD-IC family P-type ATPase [Frankiaceae bacterium]|nr:HAD-IC family P-type ATPase [Frankiaceae bacterium]